MISYLIKSVEENKLGKWTIKGVRIYQPGWLAGLFGCQESHRCVEYEQSLNGDKWYDMADSMRTANAATTKTLFMAIRIKRNGEWG